VNGDISLTAKLLCSPIKTIAIDAEIDDKWGKI
jgi:hypothetical protein